MPFLFSKMRFSGQQTITESTLRTSDLFSLYQRGNKSYSGSDLTKYQLNFISTYRNCGLIVFAISFKNFCILRSYECIVFKQESSKKLIEISTRAVFCLRYPIYGR